MLDMVQACAQIPLYYRYTLIMPIYYIYRYPYRGEFCVWRRDRLRGELTPRFFLPRHPAVGLCFGECFGLGGRH